MSFARSADAEKVVPAGGYRRLNQRSFRRWLCCAAVLAWGAVVVGHSWAQTAPAPDAQIPEVADDLDAIRARALDLVNEARQEQDLPPLVLEDKLNVAAQAHADDMHTRGYFDHLSPEGRTAQDRYVQAGGSKWLLISENIGRCIGCRPPRRIGILNRLQRDWMMSPEHRANILRQGLTRFGFGMVIDDQKRLYAVQTFSGPGLPHGLRPDEEPAPLSAADQAQQALQLFNQARAQSGGKPLEISPGLNRVARILLPDRDLENFSLESRQNLVPESESRNWQSISVLANECGGCGAVPTAADVRYFAQQWLADPGDKQDLLDARVTHVGFVIATNGEGMKVALAVLGLR